MREIAQPPASCEAETSKESIKTKTESGNCFCIPVVYIQYREREKDKVGDRPVKLNEKKRERELEGKKTYTLGVQQLWRGRQKTSKATHIKLPQRGGPLYIFPRFQASEARGQAQSLRARSNRTRDGKMFPPCVSHEHSAPQSLRAGLRLPVKREKISPVLQTTHNSQMRPERLETISFDRVYQCAQPRSPTLWLGTLQYKKFLDSSLQIRQDPNTDLYGLRLFLKFL